MTDETFYAIVGAVVVLGVLAVVGYYILKKVFGIDFMVLLYAGWADMIALGYVRKEEKLARNLDRGRSSERYPSKRKN